MGILTLTEESGEKFLCAGGNRTKLEGRVVVFFQFKPKFPALGFLFANGVLVAYFCWQFAIAEGPFSFICRNDTPAHSETIYLQPEKYKT